MRELTTMEVAGVCELAQSKCHPRHIESYLLERGLTDSEIEFALAKLDTSREHLLVEYYRTRRYRCLGWAVLGFAAYAAISSPVRVVSVPLFVYGTFMVVTGSLAPGERQTQRRTGWLYRRQFHER